MSLDSLLVLLLPDEIFEEVMQSMVDSSWLRERAEAIGSSGQPEANAKAAALMEAADAIDGGQAASSAEEAIPASAEGAP